MRSYFIIIVIISVGWVSAQYDRFLEDQRQMEEDDPGSIIALPQEKDTKTEDKAQKIKRITEKVKEALKAAESRSAGVIAAISFAITTLVGCLGCFFKIIATVL